MSDKNRNDSRLSIRIDGELKKQAKEVYSELGMDLTTAVTIFLKQSVRENSIPFQPHLENPGNIQARLEANSDNLETFDTVKELMESLNAED
ncbi:type II toxin-antitoxin system RelB/DinJ family antitoxin [Tetragenococcus solitarius]|uniref:Type II toxin-antitoxin system RelB/DinJ family antitoxin n=1 Tax=Tetragenococcus solitarius TaxID=71453 RepID=A0ABN3Y273_9ENTE|nr:type II toxin-antitoxin system RelB/DinJ family antitoxin [Tetragenococcus solitarius]